MNGVRPCLLFLKRSFSGFVSRVAPGKTDEPLPSPAMLKTSSSGLLTGGPILLNLLVPVADANAAAGQELASLAVPPAAAGHRSDQTLTGSVAPGGSSGR